MLLIIDSRDCEDKQSNSWLAVLPEKNNNESKLGMSSQGKNSVLFQRAVFKAVFPEINK